MSPIHIKHPVLILTKKVYASNIHFSIYFFRYIWPWSKKVALSHDSYTCHKFARTSPFPTQRTAGVGNFIGSVVSLNSSIGLSGEGGICPEKCRPKDHKDWLYC